MRHFLSILFFMFVCHASAQLRVGLEAGYGFYAHNDLKKLQRELASQFPVEVKAVDEFPPYWNFATTLGITVRERIIVGGSVGMGSSGARMHYQDYSGEIKSDMLVSYVMLGAPFTFMVTPLNWRWSVMAQAMPQIMYSKLKMDFSSRIGDAGESQSFKFNSVNISLEPSIIVARKLGAVGLFVKGGYHLTLLKGDVLLKNQDAFLQNNAGDKVFLDWSGLRVALGASYVFDTR